MIWQTIEIERFDMGTSTLPIGRYYTDLRTPTR
jgi:hypothetical protein